jgi:teichuronic acid biosynthesis glycosyltransferase TuaC
VRLLLVTNVYPSPRRSTKGTFNHELVTALRGAGDEVRVVVPVPWTDLLLARATAPPVPDTSYTVWWYPPRIGRATYHRWMALTVLRTVRRVTRSWTPDLVLGYWTHPDGTVALAAARELGVPAALLVGGSDVQLLTRERRRRTIIVETLRAADRVFAVGALLQRAVIALGIPPARVVAFERGVDRDTFNPGSPPAARERLGLPCDRPIMIWVGRMVPVKGLDVLLASWPAVARHPARPLLILIGDGDQRSSLERQAAEFGDTVRFVGNLAHNALPDWYRAADCVVLPSRSEGVPNVLLEGLACGTPFVASAVGSVTELTDLDSAAVPAEDVAALTAALLNRVAIPPMTRRARVVIADRSAAVAALRSDLQAMLDAAPRNAAVAAVAAT